MKNLALLALAMSLLVLTSPGLAQSGKEFSLAAGLSAPVSDFGDVATAGPQVGVNFGLQVSRSAVIGFEVFYNMYGLSSDVDDLVYSETGIDPDVDIRITQYTLTAKVNLMPTPSTIYAKFTGGMYKAAVTASVDDLSVTVDETDFGAGAGLGYHFSGHGSTGGFIEGIFHTVPGDNENTSYFDIRGGVTFKFI